MFVNDRIDRNPERIPAEQEGHNEPDATAPRDSDDLQASQNSTRDTPENNLPEQGEVEKLIRACMIRGKRHYHVKFKNLSKRDWVPEDTVPQSLVEEFLINKTYRGSKRKRQRKQLS